MRSPGASEWMPFVHACFHSLALAATNHAGISETPLAHARSYVNETRRSYEHERVDRRTFSDAANPRLCQNLQQSHEQPVHPRLVVLHQLLELREIDLGSLQPIRVIVDQGQAVVPQLDLAA